MCEKDKINLCVCVVHEVWKNQKGRKMFTMFNCVDVLADYANMNKNRKKVKKNINIPQL